MARRPYIGTGVWALPAVTDASALIEPLAYMRAQGASSTRPEYPRNEDRVSGNPGELARAWPLTNGSRGERGSLRLMLLALLCHARRVSSSLSLSPRLR